MKFLILILTVTCSLIAQAAKSNSCPQLTDKILGDSKLGTFFKPIASKVENDVDSKKILQSFKLEKSQNSELYDELISKQEESLKELKKNHPSLQLEEDSHPIFSATKSEIALHEESVKRLEVSIERLEDQRDRKSDLLNSKLLSDLQLKSEHRFTMFERDSEHNYHFTKQALFSSKSTGGEVKFQYNKGKLVSVIIKTKVDGETDHINLITVSDCKIVETYTRSYYPTGGMWLSTITPLKCNELEIGSTFISKLKNGSIGKNDGNLDSNVSFAGGYILPIMTKENAYKTLKRECDLHQGYWAQTIPNTNQKPKNQNNTHIVKE